MGRKKGTGTKVRVNVTIDKSVYEFIKEHKINLSQLVSSRLQDYVPATDETRVQFSAIAAQILIQNFIFLVEKDKKISKPYKEEILRFIYKELPKSVYKYPELKQYLESRLKVENNTHELLIIRKLLKWLESEGYDVKQYLKRFRTTRSRPDVYVPSDEEVMATVNGLSETHQKVYLMLLFSGIRVTEADTILREKPLVLYRDGYVKIDIYRARNTKRSIYAYLPEETWLEAKGLSGVPRGLDIYIYRHRMVALKYCRKWFYTKCVELGIPGSIADYYQGRASLTVGDRNYLGIQSLADKNYREVLLPYFNEINKKRSL